MNTVLTVSQITTYIRSLLDGDPNLEPVYLCGEISNFNAYQKSGHWYFSLKDANAVLRCVMFRSANQRLRFCPENGMRVLIRGRISVYERDGTYQLYAEDMLPDGAGALADVYKRQAFLDQERASVLVQSDGLQAYETITIQDIVHNQSGVAYENIVIVEVK